MASSKTVLEQLTRSEIKTHLIKVKTMHDKVVQSQSNVAAAKSKLDRSEKTCRVPVHEEQHNTVSKHLS